MTAKYNTKKCPLCPQPIQAGTEIARRDGKWAHADCATPDSRPNPWTCGNCGEAAFYRATVGALQCPSCRSLRYSVWVHRGTGEERRSMAASVPGHADGEWAIVRRWTAS